MISLIRNNVVKIVASEEEAKRLEALGFKRETITIAVENKSQNGDKNPEKNENETPTPDAVVFACPLCNKEYKTEKGLAEHMEKAHGGDDHGGSTEQIDSGADAGAEADQ